MVLQLLATILSIIIICPKFFGQDISFLRKMYMYVYVIWCHNHEK